MVVLEDLNVSGMVKNHHLAKSISDSDKTRFVLSSWSAFVTLLMYKAVLHSPSPATVVNAGHQVATVPAHYTSQKCSSCGEIVPKSLSVRTHVCSHCGYVADRDINAARNILAKYTAGAQPSEANAVGCDKRSLRSRFL